MQRLNIFFIALILLFSGEVSLAQQSVPKRIVSLNGTLTEVVDALGLSKSIVATDVTSDYPAYVKSLPKVSKNRSVSAEGVYAFRPDLVLAIEGELSPDVQNQLKALKIRVALIKQEFTVNGVVQLVKSVGSAVNMSTQANTLATQLQKDINQAVAASKSKKAVKTMFVYARGAGAMSVAGDNTAVDAVIKLAGGQNALKGFTGFKTYNTEALVAANPDAILLFDFGLSSLGGKEGILKMPGVNLTTAGKNKRIVTMDATLLNNFSIRLPLAIRTLHEKISAN
ncbi:heme/hemin ABC transporter substrate-binding protein [Sphingobacterium spiritivorum]|uniref:heme/hemin ABC transporter substrate-binding protein n=1 Tax=Sphingobacterium spiritivorum TaxID=258 RepID=UPI003DA233D6